MRSLNELVLQSKADSVSLFGKVYFLDGLMNGKSDLTVYIHMIGSELFGPTVNCNCKMTEPQHA